MSDRDLTLREAMEILSDLTPEEARAEVEAWLGEGWRTNIVTLFGVYNVEAVMRSNMLVRVEGEASTYRAAVDALKQAWRDAVGPWVRDADTNGFDEGVAYERSRKTRTTKDGRVSRVLKEDSHA